jgi:hypothetical protein
MERGVGKNTLLVVALLLEEKTVNLWKLKGSVGKLLGNAQTDSRSHYQRLRRWFIGSSTKRLWVVLLQASACLLSRKIKCLIIDGTSWQTGTHKYHFLTLSVLGFPLFGGSPATLVLTLGTAHADEVGQSWPCRKSGVLEV